MTASVTSVGEIIRKRLTDRSAAASRAGLRLTPATLRLLADEALQDLERDGYRIDGQLRRMLAEACIERKPARA